MWVGDNTIFFVCLMMVQIISDIRFKDVVIQYVLSWSTKLLCSSNQWLTCYCGVLLLRSIRSLWLCVLSIDSSSAKNVAELYTESVCCTWSIYGRRASCVITAVHAMVWSGPITSLLPNVSLCAIICNTELYRSLLRKQICCCLWFVDLTGTDIGEPV